MVQRFKNLKVFGIFLVGTTFGCATKTIIFKAAKGAQVTLVSPADLEDDGTLLGDAPVSVDVDKIKGKVVKISQAGKKSIFWFVTDAASDTTEANIKLPDDPGSVGGKTDKLGPESKVRSNRLLRLLLRSYQALSGKRFKDSRELADQAGLIDPEIAAPLVIKGLAYYQEGNLTEARAAFAKAQALDPEDKDIEALLKTVRP